MRFRHPPISPSTSRRRLEPPTLSNHMLRATLIALAASAAEAFVLTGMKATNTPLMQTQRAPAPNAMLAPETALATVNTMPSTMNLAEGELLLGSGGLIFFLFLFIVVGTVVVNFGIMKKK